jgi:hypothetical protein
MAVSDMQLGQVRVTWSGFSGSPGVSTFYIPAVNSTALTALRTMLSTQMGALPGNITLTFPSEGDIIQASTGALVSGWSVATPPTPLTGAGTGALASAQGFQIKWLTGEVADGHALKGRTFIVPTCAGVWGTDGMMTSAQHTTSFNGANALATSATPWFVWHRPVYAKTPAGTPRGAPLRVGSAAPITGCTVPSKAVVLTSRRD